MITFKLIKIFQVRIVKSDVDMTIEEYIKKHGYHVPLKNLVNEWTVEKKLYISDKLADPNKTVQYYYYDYDDRHSWINRGDDWWRPLGGGTEEVTIWKIDELSDNDMKRPMIKYLIDNDIERACWTIDGEPIDVNTTYFDPNKIITGYETHVKEKCTGTHCDLVRYVNDYSRGVYGTNITITSRTNVYKFKYIVPESPTGIDFTMTVPVICNKHTMIEKFLDVTKNNDKYSVMDFDLYYVPQKGIYFPPIGGECIQ